MTNLCLRKGVPCEQLPVYLSRLSLLAPRWWFHPAAFLANALRSHGLAWPGRKWTCRSCRSCIYSEIKWQCFYWDLDSIRFLCVLYPYVSLCILLDVWCDSHPKELEVQQRWLHRPLGHPLLASGEEVGWMPLANSDTMEPEICQENQVFELWTTSFSMEHIPTVKRKVQLHLDLHTWKVSPSSQFSIVWCSWCQVIVSVAV